MITKCCPLCGGVMTLPKETKIGDGIICPHCRGDLVYDLPKSITNPDQFAKDFADEILKKHPYKPPSKYRFCNLK